MALPRAMTIISLALIAAARIRTKAVCGARSPTDGTGMESLRWRLDRASVDRQLSGPEGLICHAEENIVRENWGSLGNCVMYQFQKLVGLPGDYRGVNLRSVDYLVICVEADVGMTKQISR
jgi:hypothetical protein